MTGASNGRRSFWSTMPGVITAIAALVTAVTGLIVVVKQVSQPDPSDQLSAAPNVTATRTTAASGSSAPATSTRPTVSLCSWYSRSRNDNWATSDPRLVGAGCGRQPAPGPDYVFVRIDGRLLSPDAEQPPGTVPLCTWYSPSRGDYWVTSDPRRVAPSCAAQTPPGPDYVFVRMEGYLYDHPVSGAVPLCSWYSESRNDNWATSDPQLVGAGCGSHTPPGPDYFFVRHEGYLLT